MVNIRSDRLPPSEALSEFRVALRGCLTEQTIGIRGKRDRRIRVSCVVYGCVPMVQRDALQSDGLELLV